MCGIVGYITLDDKVRVTGKDKFFTEALFMDTLRGAHSTGFMSLSEDFMWQYQKQAVEGPEFIQGKGYKERTKETWCAVGHNRHATQGEISTDNAHPFKHGDVTLVHNGTLRSLFDLEQNKEIAVDSELIAYNLSLVEPSEAGVVIGKLIGAYALVWFDERDQSVNMVRNQERPLHLGLNSSEDILYFMSEGYMLNCLTERMMDSSARPKAIWRLATGQILKYKKGNMVPEVARVVPFTRIITDIPWSHGQKRGDTTSTTTTPSGGSESERFAVRFCINGEIRKVPKPHLEMIEDWYHINPRKGHCFRPFKFIPYGHNNDEGYMLGRVHHPDWFQWYDARIDNVRRDQAVTYKGDWTMVVAGVDYTDHGLSQEVVCFIGRAQWYTWNGGRVYTQDTFLTDDDEVDRLLEQEGNNAPPWKMDEDEEVTLVDGPHGMITEEAFEKLTQDGCCMCMAPIDADDHLTISWVGEMGNQPLCYGCLDWTTQGGQHDFNDY